ncbi:uncharacterized protein LOC124165678 isoform X2 [Ischnura elegans]|uniref:uncharacterized protein LOC124165678 isoform X2 n=1 Tax=Ischnura elegans TaxID=197161 RepID=UPI001ED888F3|nr:uncharacterized protein LOC124165678 isoform X2 [Ischnura elegans]
MSSGCDDSADLAADASLLDPSGFENLNISDDKKSESPPKPKERRKSSTSKPKDKTKRPESISNVQMNFVNTHEVHVGHNFTYYATPQFVPAPEFVRSTSALKKTSEIKELMSCKDAVTKEEIFWLSSHVGKHWRDVGILLGYDNGQLDQFEDDYSRRGIKQTSSQWKSDL